MRAGVAWFAVIGAVVFCCPGGEAAARGQDASGWIAFDERVWFNRTPPRRGFDTWEVFVIRPNGTGKRMVTPRDPPSHDTSPSFSPDGRLIAYSAQGTGICVISVWGGARRCLTRRGADDFPVWSPTGRRIAFFRDGIWIMRSDGQRQRRLTRGKEDDKASWSPDDRWIVFARGSSVYRIAADGGSIRRLARNADWPSLSPDGRRMVVMTTQRRIDVMNSDGTGRRTIGSGWHPAWSPVGRRIVYAANGGFGLFIMDSDGRNRHLVSRTLPTTSPTWGRG